MANRFEDWYRQAEAVRHAQNSLQSGDFERSCFVSHQAAEKALRAVFLKAGMDAWGHTLTVLIGNLPNMREMVPERLVNSARILDKFYIPTRYDRISDYLPLGFPVGLDLVIYTRAEFEALKRSSQAWYRVISTGKEL